MRKRKYIQKLGIGVLAIAVAASSFSASTAELVTESMTEMQTERAEISENITEESQTSVFETEYGSEGELEEKTKEKTETEYGSETEYESETECESETKSEENIEEKTETECKPETESEEKTETERITEVQEKHTTEKYTEWETETSTENEENTETFTEEMNGVKQETEKLSEKLTAEKNCDVQEETALETEEERKSVLTAKAEKMDITILTSDFDGFPAGTQLLLYAGEDLRNIFDGKVNNWDYEKFFQNIEDEWKEEILKKTDGLKEAGSKENITGRITYLYPYYFEIIDKNGTELQLPENSEVYANFYDTEAYETGKNSQCFYAFGLHERQSVKLTENSDVYCNTEKGYLATDTGAGKCGLYSFVQIKESNESEIICICDGGEEKLAHTWDCPIFKQELEEVCNCGSEADKVTKHDVSCKAVWRTFQAACSGCEMGKEEKGLLHDDCEVVKRIHRELCGCELEEKNLEKAVENHKENSDFVKYIMKLADYENSQVEMLVSDKGQMATENISKVSGWSNGDNAVSDYLSAKFYAGKSSMQILGGSTVSGKWIQGSISKKNCLYWLPLQDDLSDRANHGARYYNVIYDYKTGKWYDMKFVIQSYRKTVLKESNKTVYPFAGFYKNKLKFGFDRQGPMVVRCQILEAGTSTEAKVKVKIPVWDIDGAQFIGVKQNNGTMDHRYYYTGADAWLRAKNGVSVAGVSGFSYVEGKFGTTAKDLETPQACAIWEMTTSDFSVAFGYYNNNTTSETTRWDRFHAFSTNTTIGDGSYGVNGAYGEVSIFSQDNVAPELQNPVKRVSADNKTWGKSLELSSITGTFYYAIDYTVLDTIPNYKFTSMVLTDTLPQGVDYVGGLKISRLEDGKTTTGWFTISTENDLIKIEATTDTLKANDFYGYTYHITFKVKMDPTEKEPVYQAASGKDIYTVSNKGTVKVKRNSTLSDRETNTVTTTASKSLPTITIHKKNEKNEYLSGAVYQITAKNNITSLAGKILYKAGEVVETITTGKNGKAVSGKIHPGAYVITETKAPSGYALNKKGQSAKVSYINQDTQAGSAEVSFVNKRLYSTIKVTKEIDTTDIVWAHGNPVFTFKVAGKDTLGNSHVYYDTVEFTKENVGSGAKARLTAVFKVYAGTYTVSEEKTARYRLASVHSVVNGSVSGQSAVLHVEGTQTDTAGPSGSAVFYNQKTTDGGQSHTAFARNSIKK